MKSLKVLFLATAVTLAYFPISAGAFGFGAGSHKYPPPWGGYGPNAGYPPYGPPPNARNVQGMWGSGPTMSWGNPERDKRRKKELDDWYRNPYRWTRDWKYVSPYQDAEPWVSPFEKPRGE